MDGLIPTLDSNLTNKLLSNDQIEEDHAHLNIETVVISAVIARVAVFRYSLKTGKEISTVSKQKRLQSSKFWLDATGMSFCIRKSS